MAARKREKGRRRGTGAPESLTFIRKPSAITTGADGRPLPGEGVTVELGPSPIDAHLAAYDAHQVARAALRDLVHPDTEAGELSELLAEIDRALAGPLHPDERDRLERIASVRALATKRPALALEKTAKNIYAAEALKLVRMIEVVAKERHAGQRWTERRCLQVIDLALRGAGWTGAALHVREHEEIVVRALRAWPRRAGRPRDDSPPTFNQALVDLLGAADFAPVSLQTVKNMRSRRAETKGHAP